MSNNANNKPWMPTPEVFWEEFQKTVKETPPYLDDKVYTSWFEKQMLEVAENNKVYCQNRSTENRREEWMNVDCVFVEKNEYNRFPLVAVEHENGGLGGKDGQLPGPHVKNASIEWAAWKCLAMRCHLSVLVAYPENKKENALIEELCQMLEGWQVTYPGQIPKFLVIFGLPKSDGTVQYTGYTWKPGNGETPQNSDSTAQEEVPWSLRPL